jgi:hypothetical protein
MRRPTRSGMLVADDAERIQGFPVRWLGGMPRRIEMVYPPVTKSTTT